MPSQMYDTARLRGQIPATTGNVYFVGSGGNAGGGDNSERPFDSIESAFNASGLTAGDTIVCLPGHTETVSAAAGITADIAGVRVIGLGSGSRRPTITFGTAVGASLRISGAGISFENFLFLGGIDALTNPIDVRAADVSLINIETRDVTGQATDFIVTTAAADRLLIDGWNHRGAAAAGADTAISIVGGDGITVRNFWIDGNFAVACIENVTTATTGVTIGGSATNNYAYTRNGADVIVTLHASATGFVGPNINARLTDNAANITEAFVGAAVVFFQPINIVNLAGESSMQTNITASTDA